MRTVVAILLVASLAQAQPTTALALRSGTISPRLAVADSAHGVNSIRLAGTVGPTGAGPLTLEFDVTPLKFTEFGFAEFSPTEPPLMFDVGLSPIKKSKLMLRTEGRLGAPEKEVEWALFEVTGPKLKTKLTLATATEDDWKSVRLLVHDKDGKIQELIPLFTTTPRRGDIPLEPCHPGCFPAGTAIRVPGGTRPVDKIIAGDAVTTIDAEGKSSTAKVTDVFVTKNKLLEIETEAGKLVTTETQPLALTDGKLRGAGELKAGDKIYRWDGKERKVTVVKSVTPMGKIDQVFNLILGEPTLFVANDYLARSKPPAPVKVEP